MIRANLSSVVTGGEQIANYDYKPGWECVCEMNSDDDDDDHHYHHVNADEPRMCSSF